MSQFRVSGYEAISAPTYQVLNSGNQDGTYCVIYGYASSGTKSFLYHLFGILFFGLPYVIFSWYPRLNLLILNKAGLNDCRLLFVTDNHDNCLIVKLSEKTVRIPHYGLLPLRYFYHQHTQYVWVPQNGEFDILEVLLPRNSIDDYLNDMKGIPLGDCEDLLKLYGENKIEVEVKSYWKLFTEEVFNPFYIFQVFSMLLWCFDDYMIYAGCVLILTVFSAVTSLIQTRKQSESLHDLVEKSKSHEVTVIRRDNNSAKIQIVVDPVKLVPGDLISIPSSNYVMPCDAVLLTGQCIVNESMLTGESVPITKTSPHSCSDPYDPLTHKRHTLFCGTQVIQTRNYDGDSVVARVVRTGFNTTKGALVKSILYPTPINLKFYKDSFKFVFVLFFIAALGMSYSLYMYIRRRADVKDIIVRTLDIITIVVPPALPAAMTVGTVYSQNRLKKMGIFSTSPLRINVCGKVKLACFDKTGTLTNEGLDMHSVIACNDSLFEQPSTDNSRFDTKCKLLQAMASCHSLTRIDGQLNGDPLDLNMFDFTKWDLEEPGSDEKSRYDMLGPTVVKPRGQQQDSMIIGGGDVDSMELPYEIGILRQFPFSSTLQCMSVICRELGRPHMVAFVKGAPEKLVSMCKPETIPTNFSTVLAHYTTRGYRVIGIAHKDLPSKLKWKDAQKMKQESIQHELTFLGLLIMRNTLKSETIPVIDTLHSANIRTVMITGDNVRTAISVARECHMVKSHEQVLLLQIDDCDNPDVIPKIEIENIGNIQQEPDIAINFVPPNYHFAMDGKTWEHLKVYYIDLLPEILVKTTIFARFQPDQKTQLIMNFQNLDYTVSMVGDGANDCGALKAAHVGVSLSQAEASVAAPFTSSIQDISCLVELILEGRCALVTSFAVFKYMAMYSIIQFFTILILYRLHSLLGDAQFLFIDLIVTTSFAVTVGLQGPSRVLCQKRPLASLVSLKNLIPLAMQVIGSGCIQVATIYYLFQQKWFVPIPPSSKEEIILSWENTTLFPTSSFHYINIALVYSKGRPFRKPLRTNFLLILNAVALISFTLWLMLYPIKELANLFELEWSDHFTDEQIVFRYMLTIFPAAHLLLAVFIETCIADTNWLKKLIHFITRKNGPRNKYKMLLSNNTIHNRLCSFNS